MKVTATGARVGDPSLSCIGIASSSCVVVIWCWRVVILCCCHMVLSHRRPASLSYGVVTLAVSLFCSIWLSVREVGTSLPWLTKEEQRTMINVVVRCLVATSPSATWHLDSAWSFSSISGHLGLWAVVWVHGRWLAFVGGRVHCTSLWALGALWWLSLCGGGWMKKEGMSHIVTLVWCLNSHARSHQ